jgi:hypothetical protein
MRSHRAMSESAASPYFWSKSLNRLPCEHWGKSAPESLPLVAVDRHQPVAQTRRQYTPLKSTLVVGRLILDENLADSRRVADHDDRSEGKAARNDQFFKMRSSPTFERIGPQRLHHRN